MSKHTPGPWSYVGRTRIRGEYGPIANVFASGITNDERAANARLIAAAPEMYDILLDIAGYKLLDGEYRLEAEILDKMADVLAKIRGEV